jgi:hypothetical protein
MRSNTTAWTARLLAAVTALALVVACIVGAYAHAAGHALPAHEHAVAASGVAHHTGHRGDTCQPAVSKTGPAGHAHGCDGTSQSPLDCCDTLCHGGQAILAPSVLVPHPALSAPLIQSAAHFDGAGSAGLDRPPRPFRPA